MIGPLATLAASVALLAPWVALSLCLFDRWSWKERAVIGASLGLAASITLCHGFAWAGRFEEARWLYLALWPLAALTAVYRRPRLQADGSREFWLALALVVSAAAVPTFATRAPLGWDPAFHSILAEKVRLSGGLVTDWRPFEDIELNYPLGSHLILATLADVTGEPVHHVFQVLHLVVQTLAALLVYLVGRRIFECERTALLGMCAYGLLGNWGTFFSYYEWGGLPTEMALVLLMTTIWLVLSPEVPLRTLLGALALGSIVLVHHLAALQAALVLGSYAALAIATRERSPFTGRIVGIAAAALVAFSWFIVPYALRIRTLGGTDVLRFYDEPLLVAPDLAAGMGIPLLLLGGAGLWRARNAPGHGPVFLIAWVAILLSSYCALDYVYRFGARWLTGEDFTAFTPSRFVTLLSYPLAIAAGSALEQLRVRIEPVLGSRRTWAAALVMLAAFLFSIPSIREATSQQALSPEVESRARWIREHAPEEAFVFYRAAVAPKPWLAFLTWRASDYTPIPASENRDAVKRARRALGAVVHDRAAVRALLRERRLEGYVYSVDDEGRPRLERL